MMPILILAAGASSRMRGTDKLLETVDGTPLLARVVDRALSTGHPVFVALPATVHLRGECIPNGAQIVVVSGAAEGIGGTLREAVAGLPPFVAFMVVLADLPDLTTQDMLAIRDAQKANPDFLVWRGATTAGKPGHPIVFDASLRDHFKDLKGDIGGETIIAPLGKQTHLTTFDTDRARLDLDTPEDWAAWRAQSQNK